MAFPISPTNGQQSTIANVVYQYASATQSWTVIPGYANSITATGNISANYFVGNGAALTGVTATGATALTYGTTNITTAPSGNANITVAGTPNVAVFSTNGANISGYVTATGNVTGNYIFGNGALLTGVITSVANINSGTSNVTVVSSGGNVEVAIGGTSNIVVFSTVGANISGYVTATGNITGGNLLGTSIVGTLTTAAQTNITSVGTLGALTVTANVAGGNLTTAGQVVATGNVSGGNLNVTGNIVDTGPMSLVTASSGNVNLAPNGSIVLIATTTGANITGTLNATGNANVGNLGAATVVATTLTGTLSTVAQTNITSVGTLGSLSVTGAITGGSLGVSTGNITGGNLILSGAIEDSAQLDIKTTASNGNIVLTPNGTGVIVAAKDIVNGQANGVGNIGSATEFFNTVFAKATSAQYADLAEMYVSDQDYPPGTVVEFGGVQEITITTRGHSTAVAGIVSTNPSYLMNSTQTGDYVLPVALTGRVPCQVQGPVRKGDVLVSSATPGVAQRIGANWQPGCVLGKAMEEIKLSTIQTIEVAVGRL